MAMLTGLRQATSADVELQRLVNQTWLSQCSISLVAPSTELVFLHTISNVLVLPALLSNGGEGP
jgi:hypothetical protein